MITIESIAGIDKITKQCALAIGNFDGVHLGHKKIFDTVRQAAALHNCRSTVAMTFFPHPAIILHPERLVSVLTPLEVKKTLVEASGLDFLIVISDSLKLLNMSPRAFVDEFLMQKLQPRVIVEGKDFRFGYGRSGDVETLRQLGGQRNFEVLVAEEQEIMLNDRNVHRISSTLVRHLLDRGSVCDAAKVLGRPYRLIGEIIEGRGIGKSLGYPTANIHTSEQVIPAEGVYCGFVEIGDDYIDVCRTRQKMPAVFSIGRAKTFVTDHPLLTEAHVLDRSVGDVYGKYLAMDFVERIRNQICFENAEELKKQIAADCQKAMEILRQY